VSGAGAQAAERSRAADALTLAPLSEDALARFAEFVAALYVDDPGPAPMSLDRALRQARRLLGDRPPAWAFLLRDADGESIGYCILAPFFSNEFGGEMLYLDELYVVPERRGRGVGSAALAAVRNWAEQRGFVRLALEVNRGNPEARRLYERAGFAVEERDTMALQLKAIPEE
jgi:GNAT superfamily N-acetyltransferase